MIRMFDARSVQFLCRNQWPSIAIPIHAEQLVDSLRRLQVIDSTVLEQAVGDTCLSLAIYSVVVTVFGIFLLPTL
jgi:hypothetical protein